MSETTSGAGTRPPRRQLNMGMIGIGVGGSRILPAMEGMEEINLLAGADIDADTRSRFSRRYPAARAYASAEALCDDPDIEAVWISTPNRHHAEHAIIAAERGKHIVIEKPMALNLDQASQMVEVAAKNGVTLLAGHTRSYTMPIRAMRRIILSGKLGRLQAVNILSYTDWLLRPRMPDELDVAQGGGIVYRQSPHQVDTVRFLGGGLLRSVRAMTGGWMANRPAPGYYAAYLEFVDGTPATVIHNGNGYFLGTELVPWGSTSQTYSIERRTELRRQIREGARNEATDKAVRRDETLTEATSGHHDPRPWVPEDMGLAIVSCERGDIRQSKWGLYVYDDDGVHEIAVKDETLHGATAELGELYNAVVLGAPIFHDGAWGMATLEVGLAMMESATNRREIELTHQVAGADGYDADLAVSYLDS